MRSVFVFTALATLLLVACGGDDDEPTLVSGIEGTVLYDPPCGEAETACPASGVSELLITPAGSTAVIPALTNSSGEFVVPLAPGDYTVSARPETQGGEPEPRTSEPISVTVVAEELTLVEITYPD